MLNTLTSKNKPKVALSTLVDKQLEDHTYHIFIEWFSKNLRLLDGPFFTSVLTGKDTISEVYLKALGKDNQQYKCRECIRFLNTYGSLLTWHNGRMVPLLELVLLLNKEPKDAESKKHIAAFRKVLRAFPVNITGAYTPYEKTWGEPEKGGFEHLHWTFTRLKPAKSEADARKRNGEIEEQFRCLQQVAKEAKDWLHPLNTILDYLIPSDMLQRPEKIRPAAEWLRETLNIHQVTIFKDNYLWYQAATAPPGFATPRSGILGALVADLQTKTVKNAVKAFNERIDPTKYQRIQAGTTVGNVAAAKQYFMANGLQQSLQRKIATHKDVTFLWKAQDAVVSTNTEVSESLFGNLPVKNSRTSKPTDTNYTPLELTWKKFCQLYITNGLARNITLLVNAQERKAYGAFLTAVNNTAPFLFQWDNHVSWYVTAGGSRLHDWMNIPAREGYKLVKVVGLVAQPFTWSGNGAQYKHLADGVCFVLEGFYPKALPSSCLFPEILRADLKPYRATIETYSNNNKVRNTLLGLKRSKVAGGLFLFENSKSKVELLVETAYVKQRVNIVLWD